MFSRGEEKWFFRKKYTAEIQLKILVINEKNLINKPYLNNILIDNLPKLNLGSHVIVNIMYYSHLF